MSPVHYGDEWAVHSTAWLEIVFLVTKRTIEKAEVPLKYGTAGLFVLCLPFILILSTI